MIEPMKRMTLYPLLLKAILKGTKNEKEGQFLKEMVRVQINLPWVLLRLDIYFLSFIKRTMALELILLRMR